MIASDFSAVPDLTEASVLLVAVMLGKLHSTLWQTLPDDLNNPFDVNPQTRARGLKAVVLGY